MKGDVLVMSWMETASTPPRGSLSQTYRLRGLGHVSGYVIYVFFLSHFIVYIIYTLYTLYTLYASHV